MPHRRLALTAALGLFTALAVTGCGNSRTPVPSLAAPAAPGGFRTVTATKLGFRIAVPKAWTPTVGHDSLIASYISGTAVIALWRYPSTGPVPATPAALRDAVRRLIAQARARDPRLTPIRTAVKRLGGAPTVELDAFEHIGGLLRRVRSTHVFLRASELVLDEYAPPELFHRVDHEVFSPVKRSLSVLRGGA